MGSPAGVASEPDEHGIAVGRGTRPVRQATEHGRHQMARRPNYGFEKRQKELEKQKKKEAKAEKKDLRKQAAAEREEGHEPAGEPASGE